VAEVEFGDFQAGERGSARGNKIGLTLRRYKVKEIRFTKKIPVN
jgi:hypothetical protein